MVVVHNLTSVTIEKQANCVARFLMAVMELSLNKMVIWGFIFRLWFLFLSIDDASVYPQMKPNRFVADFLELRVSITRWLVPESHQRCEFEWRILGNLKTDFVYSFATWLSLIRFPVGAYTNPLNW